MITTSAPGKLFLIGEYAVLEGAPALLTAVDRRVRVRLGKAAGPGWRITAPNLDLHDYPLGPHGELPDTIDPASRSKLAVFDAVRHTIAAEVNLPDIPVSVHIDASAFVRNGDKLGLGSSAAVAAALGLALAGHAGLSLSRAELTERMIRAHRRAQDGAGSGGDVAACIYGGVISYTRGWPPTPMEWPASLAGLVVMTGSGARTVNLVARVQALAEHDPQTHAVDMARLCELAQTTADTLANGRRFMQHSRAYFQALCQLDAHADAGIVTARHRQLQSLVESSGGLFKTCGAGGGDIALVFTVRGHTERTVRRALDSAGADIIPLVFGAPGVRRETRGAAVR